MSADAHINTEVDNGFIRVWLCWNVSSTRSFKQLIADVFPPNIIERWRGVTLDKKLSRIIAKAQRRADKINSLNQALEAHEDGSKHTSADETIN